MHSDRFELEQYPFAGVFYVPVVTKSADGNLLDDDEEEETETENIILETPCDIQETNKMFTSGAITAHFNIYFPFCKEDGIEVRRGMMFRSTLYTMPVSGTVVSVYPCQKGGCVAYIKDIDV